MYSIQVLCDWQFMYWHNSLLSSQRDWHMAQQEIVSQLLPLFITNHPTYSALLHEAWHGAVSYLYKYACVCTCTLQASSKYLHGLSWRARTSLSSSPASLQNYFTQIIIFLTSLKIPNFFMCKTPLYVPLSLASPTKISCYNRTLKNYKIPFNGYKVSFDHACLWLRQRFCKCKAISGWISANMFSLSKDQSCKTKYPFFSHLNDFLLLVYIGLILNYALGVCFIILSASSLNRAIDLMFRVCWSRPCQIGTCQGTMLTIAAWLVYWMLPRKWKLSHQCLLSISFHLSLILRAGLLRESSSNWTNGSLTSLKNIK